MTTYQQISRLRKYVLVDPHAVDQYKARIHDGIHKEGIEQRLINAYLRGMVLNLSRKRRLRQALKYQEGASYYKYGDLVVVVRETGPRYDMCEKTILTCYPYTKSKFDPGVFE